MDIEERTADLAATGARVDALVADRDRLHGRLADTAGAFHRVEAENQELRSITRAISTDLDERQHEIDGLAKERDVLLGDMEKQKRSLSHFDRVMSDVRRENENLRAAIDDYTSSQSWRITAPFRMVTSLFRR